MNPTVSIFQSMTTKGEPVPILEILAQIQGGKWAAKIAKLRNEKDPDRAKNLKRGLPGFTASAKTNGKRKAGDVIAHSGLLQVDVDKIGMEAARTLRDALQAEPCAFAAWLSPSGNGLKVLIIIPADISRHAESFAAVERLFLERWQVKIDAMCKDVSRLCFVSHDPDLWTNPDAVEIELEEQSLQETTDSPTHNQTILLHLNSESESESKTESISTQQPPKEHQFTKPELARLFHTLVRCRAGVVEPGTRNAHLVELVPFLFTATAESVTRLFVAAFHREHEDVFSDPLQQSMAETENLLRGVAASYVRALPPESLTAYNQLDDIEKAVFRICRALAQLDTEEMPPGEFFLSCVNLSTRAGILSMTAHRILKSFVASGILATVTKGRIRETGKRGIATVFRYLRS